MFVGFGVGFRGMVVGSIVGFRGVLVGFRGVLVGVRCSLMVHLHFLGFCGEAWIDVFGVTPGALLKKHTDVPCLG
jgi:hypothetical protein